MSLHKRVFCKIDERKIFEEKRRKEVELKQINDRIIGTETTLKEREIDHHRLEPEVVELQNNKSNITRTQSELIILDTLIERKD